MAAVTSSFMQMSQNSNANNYTYGGPFKESLVEFSATSGFGGHFEFSDFNRFLTGSQALKVLMVHISVIRRSKSIR